MSGIISAIEALDVRILEFFQNSVRTEWLTPIVKAITYSGDKGIIAIMLCIVLLFNLKSRKIGIGCSMALLMEYLCNDLFLKKVVARVRPYDLYKQIECIVPFQHDYSFPSGHTGSCFAVAFTIFMNAPKKYGIPALIYAALMGISRIYVGVHYPSDVICGMILGFITACISTFVYRKLLHGKNQNRDAFQKSE